MEDLERMKATLARRKAELAAQPRRELTPEEAELARLQGEEWDSLNHIPDGVRQGVGRRVREIRTD